jgi:hypothetical protein
MRLGPRLSTKVGHWETGRQSVRRRTCSTGVSQKTCFEIALSPMGGYRAVVAVQENGCGNLLDCRSRFSFLNTKLNKKTGSPY